MCMAAVVSQSTAALDRASGGGGGGELGFQMHGADNRGDKMRPAGGGGGGGPRRAALHEHIASSFKHFDSGDKGWLDRHDLKCAFASLTGYKPSALEIQHITARCPNGEVDLRHFAAYMEERMTSRGETSEEHMRRVFKAFDLRHAGRASHGVSPSAQLKRCIVPAT